MSLRAAILIYLMPTLLFGISVIASWGDYGLYLGSYQLLIFLMIDLLVILCMVFLLRPISISWTTFGFDYTHIKLLVYTGSALVFWFIADNTGALNLVEYGRFAELYRNGYFKGSGLYTVIILRILPLIIAYTIFQRGLTRPLVLPLFMVILCCLVLGFRVYLMPIFLACIAHYFKRGYLLRILVGFFFSLALMLVFKLYLDHGSGAERSLISLILNPFLRIMPVYLLDESLYLADGHLSCLLPVTHYFSDCDSETVKQALVSGNQISNLGIPNIGKYSGVAYPLKLYFFNAFGTFGYLFISILNLVLVCLLFYSTSSSSQIFRFIVFGVYIFFTAAAVEDMLIFRACEVAITLSLMVYIFKRLKFAKN